MIVAQLCVQYVLGLFLYGGCWCLMNAPCVCVCSCFSVCTLQWSCHWTVAATATTSIWSSPICRVAKVISGLCGCSMSWHRWESEANLNSKENVSEGCIGHLPVALWTGCICWSYSRSMQLCRFLKNALSWLLPFCCNHWHPCLHSSHLSVWMLADIAQSVNDKMLGKVTRRGKTYRYLGRTSPGDYNAQTSLDTRMGHLVSYLCFFFMCCVTNSACGRCHCYCAADCPKISTWHKQIAASLQM